jgi:hypothetical protein
MAHVTHETTWMPRKLSKKNNIIENRDALPICFQTYEQHLFILDVVMNRLSENHIKINLNKCCFGNNEVSYLGFRLMPNRLKPCKDKLKEVETAKVHATKEEIKSFVELYNFVRTHFKDFTRICKLLKKDTRKKYSKGPITAKALEAFVILKTMLCPDPIMV